MDANERKRKDTVYREAVTRQSPGKRAPTSNAYAEGVIQGPFVKPRRGMEFRASVTN